MAIAFDAASGGNVNPSTSLTVSHTCTGADRVLFVAVVGDRTDIVTGVTYAGTAMSLVDKIHPLGDETSRWLYLYALTAPSTGANNIVASASSSCYLEINAASYTGVSQSGQPDAYASASGQSNSVTTTADNSWVVGAQVDVAGAITAGSGTTLRNTVLVAAIGDSGSAVTPAGSKTLTFAGPGTNDGIIVASFAPASGGDTTAPTLTSPTGTATGATTGSGTVSTDEGNGTLYYIATINSTETAAYVKSNGATQSISSTGSKNVSFSGLSAYTTYYAHYVHRDAAGNDSSRVSSSSFTTDGTITVSSPVQYKVHQRSGSTGPIAISGTYAGAPTNIEASFNGGSYATIAASPTGGTFSGTLSSQAQGQGTLTVRFSNQTSISATVADVGIGDVFVVAGDSIAEGRGTNAQSYSHATLKAAKYTQADAWGNGNDGIDTGTSNGSHWPLLATQIMASQGVPVAFISCGTGSTDVAGSDNQWVDGNSAYVEMEAQVSGSGVNGVRGVLMHLGPNAVINASTLSQATYNTAIDDLAADIATDLPGAPKLCIGIFGEVTAGSPPDRRAAIDNLRAAIIQAHGDNANIKPGPCLIDQDYSDGVHPASDTELQAVAARWWLALSETYYSGSGGRGPRLSLARWNGARNQLTVFFDRALKTGLTFGAGAWAVKDNGSAMTVSSVSYHGTNANAVILSTSAAATGGAGTTTLSLGSSNDAAGVVIPKSTDISMPSGSAVQLPAEPILAATVGEAPTINVTLTSDGSTPVASASSLKWAWFDQATPDAFAAPTDKGASESTDGSGALAITLGNSAKVSGEVGWLIVTNSDGTTTQSPAHKAFSGPVAIS